MANLAPIGLVMLVGCGGSGGGDGGTVEVSYSLGAGALVVSDSSDATARTDADGHAVLDGVLPGATVFVSDNQSTARKIVAISGVSPGESLRIGPPELVLPASIGAMTFDVPTPPAAPYDYYHLVSSCSFAGDVAQLADTSLQPIFDARCTATVDVTVIAYRRSITPPTRVVVAYAHLPAVPFVVNGSVVVEASAWQPPQTVQIDLAGALAFDDPQVMVGGAYVTATATTIMLPDFPLTPGELVVEVESRISGGGFQRFQVRLPAVAAQTLALADVVAPWVVASAGSPGLHTAFTIDDVGGTLGPGQLLEMSYSWFGGPWVDNELRWILDPATVDGVVDFPVLPEPLLVDGDRPIPQPDPTLISARLVRVDADRTYATLHLAPDLSVLTDPTLTRFAVSSGGSERPQL